MCCAFTILVLLGPRVASVIWWLTQPVRWQAAFSGWVLPVLGILFLPWLTLMYVIVAPGGVTGLDWLWLALALFADIGSDAGGAFGNRSRFAGAR